MTMIKITLPDGSVKEFSNGATPMDVAMSISEGLARNVIFAALHKRISTIIRARGGIL
jgi:threonyl-tRNA synthetase